MQVKPEIVDEFGDGLDVVIHCRNRLIDDWTSFVSWFSLRECLPDAKVVVACERGRYDMLKWCPRQSVPRIFYSPSRTDNLRQCAIDALWIPPEVSVHETLTEKMSLKLREDPQGFLDEYCLPAKSEIISPFCSIAGGCGGFVFEKWIDINSNPLGYADRLSVGHLTPNERRVFALWRRASTLYEFIG